MSKTVPGPATVKVTELLAVLDTQNAAFVMARRPPPVSVTAVGRVDARINASSVRFAPGAMENVCPAPDVPVSRLMENGVASASTVTVCVALTENDAMSFAAVPGTPFGLHFVASAQRPSPPFHW